MLQRHQLPNIWHQRFLENPETRQTAGLCIHWGLCGNLQSLRLSLSNDSTQICALWPWESGMTLEFRSPSSVQPKRKHRGQSAGINHTFALVCSLSAMFPFTEINFKVSAQSDGFYYGALCESSDFVLFHLPPSLPSPALCSSAAGVHSLLSWHTNSIASSWDFFLLSPGPLSKHPTHSSSDPTYESKCSIGLSESCFFCQNHLYFQSFSWK